MGPPFPRVIIFSLDFFTFNPRWVTGFENVLHDDIKYDELPLILKKFVKESWALPAGILKSPTDPIYGVPAVGLLASNSGVGFRIDGSYQYGWVFDSAQATPDAAGFIERIKNGGDTFPFADRMSERELNDFRTFVAFCKRNGISLVGVTMPYSAEVVDAVEKSDRHGIWRQFRGADFQRWLSDQGVIYFDYARTKTFGGSEEEFVDGLHPSERAYVRILLAMLKDERFNSLLPRLDPERLAQALPKATRFEVFRNEF